MYIVFSIYLLVTTGYLVVTCGYLVVTFGYLIATTGYFWLILVLRFRQWFRLTCKTLIMTADLFSSCLDSKLVQNAKYIL